MSIKNNCSICGKLCYCKKLAGVCKACRGDKRWSAEGRRRGRDKYRKMKRSKLSG